MDRDILAGFPWATLGRPERGAKFATKCKQQRGFLHLLTEKPLVSFVIDIPREANRHYINECFASLSQQTYPHWEAICVMHPSDSILLPQDPRFHAISSDEMSAAERKNIGLWATKGEWVGFVDASDVVSPTALFQILSSLSMDAQADLVYSNEALIDSSSKRSYHFLSKPPLSSFTLLHTNYIGRFWVVRRSVLEQLGGLDISLGWEAEHEFLLRAEESVARFRLVPFFLYYRRETLSKVDTSKETLRLLQKTLEQRQFRAAILSNAEGKSRVVPEITEPEQQLISVIICFRDRAALTTRCLDHLAKQVGKCPVEIILVNNQSKIEERTAVETHLQARSMRWKIVDYPHPFNFAAMHNLAVREHAQGKYLLLLNNDLFLSGEKSLDEWVAWTQLPWVGTCGILLRYFDGSVQHGGFQSLFGSFSRLVRIYHVQDEKGFPFLNKEVFGNTFAACMIKTETYRSVGGLNEIEFPNGLGDVAFNFDCLRRGLCNIYLASIEGVHLESASRGAEYEYWEYLQLERKYADILQKMLRMDLGIDRIPGTGPVIANEIREKIRKKFMRLKEMTGFQNKWKSF